MAIPDIGIAARFLEHRLIAVVDAVGLAFEPLRPVGKCVGGAARPLGSGHQLALDRFGVQQRRDGRASADPFDLNIGGLLGFLVVKRLADNQQGRIIRHRQPVSGLLVTADDDFKTAVRSELHIGKFDLASGSHCPIDGIAVRFAADGEIRHRVALASDAIFAIPPDHALLVQVIGIVRADFQLVIGQQKQAGKVGVRTVHQHVQRSAGQTAQIPQALCLIERAGGGRRALQHIAGLCQLCTKIAPYSIEIADLRIWIGHRTNLSRTKLP